MKVAIAICLCLLIGACAGSHIRPDPNYVAFMHTAVLYIEGRRTTEFTYVVPTSIDPRAREALASVRKVVTPSEVPASSKVPFSNYIEINKLQIVGDTALIEGTIDPYEHNGLNCGLGFSFPFKHVNGAWLQQVSHWHGC
jgi:hypothetical protein